VNGDLINVVFFFFRGKIKKKEEEEEEDFTLETCTLFLASLLWSLDMANPSLEPW
jgi:hypothetical protein